MITLLGTLTTIRHQNLRQKKKKNLILKTASVGNLNYLILISPALECVLHLNTKDENYILAVIILIIEKKIHHKLKLNMYNSFFLRKKKFFLKST